MAKDSGLWEAAYASYGKYFPESKHNVRTKKHRKVVAYKTTEPMLLQEEYNEILKQIKTLTKRRQAIKQQMRKAGYDPIRRADYFERPILLYALRLESNCWYVGMSRNVDRRFKAHKKGNTIWTKEHPALEIVEVRETGLTSDSEVSRLEDDMTIEYAMMYGSAFVRGGAYCQRYPRWPDIVLQNELVI